MKKLLLFLLLPLTMLGANRVDPLMVFTDGRVANYTNVFSANSNRIWEVLGGTNHIAGKLASTNGIAVNLTGSLTNVTVDGGGLLLLPSVTAAINGLTKPVAYQVFQRTNSTTGVIEVEATVAGPTGTEVEARFDGGSWTSIGETDFSGTVTGSLAGSVGQGAFEIRIVGQTNATSVSPVSIGDVFAIWGQSNGSGRLTSNQSFTNSGTVASMFGNDYTWKLMADATDSSTDQVDTVSSDTDSLGMGSVWPLVADLIINSSGVPVAFVQCTKGGTGFSGSPNWNPDTDPFDRDTLFGSALYRTQITGARAVLWWQGEGGFDDATGNAYVTPFNTMVSAAVAEIPGLKFIPCKLQECVGVTSARLTNGWYAIGRLWNENTNVLRGPTLADAPVGDASNILTENEGTGSPYYHLKTSTNGAAAAYRWATNLVAHFP